MGKGGECRGEKSCQCIGTTEIGDERRAMQPIRIVKNDANR